MAVIFFKKFQSKKKKITVSLIAIRSKLFLHFSINFKNYNIFFKFIQLLFVHAL